MVGGVQAACPAYRADQEACPACRADQGACPKDCSQEAGDCPQERSKQATAPKKPKGLQWTQPAVINQGKGYWCEYGPPLDTLHCPTDSVESALTTCTACSVSL